MLLNACAVTGNTQAPAPAMPQAYNEPAGADAALPTSHWWALSARRNCRRWSPLPWSPIPIWPLPQSACARPKHRFILRAQPFFRP